MQKIYLAFLAVVFLSSLCFAQEPSNVVRKWTLFKKAVVKPAETKTFTGKVDSVLLGNPLKRIKPEIVVVDKNGVKLKFRYGVMFLDTIKDKNGKRIPLVKIARGDKIVIEYETTTKGTNIAKYIKVSK